MFYLELICVRMSLRNTGANKNLIWFKEAWPYSSIIQGQVTLDELFGTN